eukprot:CAMPEP_0174966120 /NCGR_PEP_ID=MMETSP0004_2-20121128/6810_1 /TAXON_ID=420556 /ORGANISM="Ochromonas sp., Strain CCMP1393" /LENGTH=274 /DNA_ID=CAMNT_0016215023 /DNA_START=70 /DNA_END=895 /DNA_ORIENTATION=+
MLFQRRMPEVRLSFLQVAIILATGLQRAELATNQVLAFFNKTVRKITSHLRGLIEADAALTLPSSGQVQRIERQVQGMTALNESLSQDQRQDELAFHAQQAQKEMIMGQKELTQHTIGANLLHLEQALQKGVKQQLAIPSSISVPRTGSSSGGNSDSNSDRHGDDVHNDITGADTSAVTASSKKKNNNKKSKNDESTTNSGKKRPAAAAGEVEEEEEEVEEQQGGDKADGEMPAVTPDKDMLLASSKGHSQSLTETKKKKKAEKMHKKAKRESM